MSHRRFLVWSLLAVWTLVFGAPGFTWHGLIEASGLEMALATATVGSLLLALAVAMSLVDGLVRPSLSVSSMAEAAGALAVFCFAIGALVYTEGLERDGITAMRNEPLLERELDRAYDLPNRASGVLVARLVYHDLGLRIGYRQEDGAAVIFEPTAKDQELRSNTITRHRDAASLLSRLERHASFLRTTTFIRLASLPTITFLYLLWLRRRP